MSSRQSSLSRKECHFDVRVAGRCEIPADRSVVAQARYMGRGESAAPGLGIARRPRRWTDERIEKELRQLVDENKGRLPTSAQLVKLGLTGLQEAIGRRGIRYWSARLGVPLAPGQDRSPYGIARARIDVAEVLAKHGYLPNTNRLRDLGYPRLAGFIVKQGGVKRFAARYELELPTRG